jgi:hypothetical protein
MKARKLVRFKLSVRCENPREKRQETAALQDTGAPS